MNKSFYKVVYSDIKGKAPSYLPLTAKTKFRSFGRASQFAKNLHKQNRDVTLIESDDRGYIASWKLIAGKEATVFEFNESRTDVE